MRIGGRYHGRYEAPAPVRKPFPGSSARQAPPQPTALQRAVSGIACAALLVTGLSVAAATVEISLKYSDAMPILLSPPDSATAQLTGMLDAVCQGDYAQAGTYLLGTPDLGVEDAFADPLGALLWAELQQSLSYTLTGECYTTADGLAQDIALSYLDLDSVTQNLKIRSQALLEERVAAAEDTAQIYDENNEYREDFVMNILYDAAQAALAEDARTATVALTVNLKYQGDRWLVVVDDPLLDAISGGILY